MITTSNILNIKYIIFSYLHLFILQAVITKVVVTQELREPINSWHFHTYFHHWDNESVYEAVQLRNKVEALILDGALSQCRTNIVNFAPRGPHLLGQFEVCCNSTSLNDAMAFFMENRGNLSVLFHPLTREELLDHTDRAMFLGKIVKMDTSILSIDLFDDVDNCSAEEIEHVDPELLIL